MYYIIIVTIINEGAVFQSGGGGGLSLLPPISPPMNESHIEIQISTYLTIIDVRILQVEIMTAFRWGVLCSERTL